MELVLEKKEDTEERAQYIQYLITQYQQATGRNNIKEYSTGFRESFLEWSKERKKISETYKIILKELGIDLNTQATVEIGKGINDTIVYNEQAKVITPYPYNMYGTKYQNKITKAKLIIKTPNNQNNNKLLENVDTLITHNPYDGNHILNWNYLFDENYYNIAIGIFGKKYDRNRSDSIQVLKELIKMINETYQVIEEETKDNYYYIVTNALTRRKERR